jgi:hypothetical protein
MENTRQKSMKSGWFVASAIIIIPVTIVIYQSCKPQRMGTADPAAANHCKAFAEAEEIYHRTNHSGNGVLKYATSLKELYAANPETPLIDKTLADAEIGPAMVPKAGYVFKVLTAQGPHATGGVRNYVNSDGNAVLGYAFVARPEPYSSGLKTYTINGNGTIFEKDLGPDTAAIVDKMTEFDPDPKWVPTQ